MWNNNKSITLSLAACFVVFALIGASMIGIAVFPIEDFLFMGICKDSEYSHIIFCVIFYFAAFFGVCALYLLIKMLFNIKSGNVFVAKNVLYLRVISWCCFAVCGITAVSSLFFVSLFVVSIAAGFVGLILRVVKNVLQGAVNMRVESELTI